MRFIAIAMLVTTVLAASFVISTVNALCTSEIINKAFENKTTMNALMIGDIHHLFLLKEVRQSYLNIPLYYSFVRCIDWTALMITGSLIVGIIWLLRFKLNTNWLVVGLTVISCSVIPYSVGRIALHNNTIAEHCGPWTVTMLLGLLYPLLAGAVCAIAELRTRRYRFAQLN